MQAPSCRRKNSSARLPTRRPDTTAREVRGASRQADLLASGSGCHGGKEPDSGGGWLVFWRSQPMVKQIGNVCASTRQLARFKRCRNSPRQYSMIRSCALLAFLRLFTFDSYCICTEQGPVYNVRNFGARGDDSTIDTQALNNAIDACSSAGGGQVLVPVGKYLTGNMHLKSNVAFQLDAGAQLVGTKDLNQYESFTPPDGCMLPTIPNWHRALVLANGAENIAITGQGVINGSNVVDAEGEEGVRGPHGVLFG